jgi:PhoH-like ATPase
VVTLVGPAGTGKTLLAMAAALTQMLDEDRYRKILITRPIVPLGKDLGFLPGSKEEKLHHWMGPIRDNLDYLLSSVADGKDVVQGFLANGKLEMEAMTYIRGRSMPKQCIICDEAQNLTPKEMKTLITRAGENSKIVITGDPDQIDHPYLDSCTNGLTYLVERCKDEEITGHVTLSKGERSDIAEMGARKL